MKSMNEVLEEHLSRLMPLGCPIPANLETALGYDRAARFVAFLWATPIDELTWDDGQSAFTGASWVAWLSFIGHPKVALHLEEFNFGHSESEAVHAFVLDRTARRAYAGERAGVGQLLYAQHEHEHSTVPSAKPEPITVSREQLEVLLDQKIEASRGNCAQLPRDAAEIERRLKQEAREHDRMLLELDQFTEMV